MKRTHAYKPEKSKSQPIPQPISSDQAQLATPVPPPLQAKTNEEGLAEWKAQQEKWERFGTPWMDKVPNPSGELAQPWIQRKLTLGQPGDKYEQEADRVASQVVQQINAPSLSQFNQEQSVQQENELEGEMQAKSLRAAIQRRQAMTDEEASADLESSINSARGGGQPLDAVLQQSMGQAMGADFSGVRVHTDTQSNHLNQSIQARAFTTGQDVFFRSGAYQPGSRGGQELIAHELTHVVQQNGYGVQLRKQSNVLHNNGISELKRQGIQREEEKKEEDLTKEEEQEWLQAKLQISHSAATTQQWPQIQRQLEPTIQRAWTGRRQLTGLGFLGKPWVLNKSGNLVNMRLYHEHIFFQDEGTPPDYGHMGKSGLGTDNSHTKDEYSKVRTGLYDSKMRKAVAMMGDPGNYSLISNNCQDYVQGVLKHYDTL